MAVGFEDGVAMWNAYDTTEQEASRVVSMREVANQFEVTDDDVSLGSVPAVVTWADGASVRGLVVAASPYVVSVMEYDGTVSDLCALPLHNLHAGADDVPAVAVRGVSRTPANSALWLSSGFQLATVVVGQASVGSVHVFAVRRDEHTCGDGAPGVAVGAPAGVVPSVWGSTVALVDGVLAIIGQDAATDAVFVAVYQVTSNAATVTYMWHATVGSRGSSQAAVVSLSHGGHFVAVTCSEAQTLRHGRVVVFSALDADNTNTPLCNMSLPSASRAPGNGRASLAFDVSRYRVIPDAREGTVLAAVLAGSDDVAVVRVNASMSLGMRTSGCALVGTVHVPVLEVAAGGEPSIAIAFDDQLLVTSRPGRLSGGHAGAVTTTAVCGPGYVRSVQPSGTTPVLCVPCPAGQLSVGGVAASKCGECVDRECPMPADQTDFSGHMDEVELENGATYRVSVRATAESGR